MAEHDSPTLARRRVRVALREFRDQADKTQQQVADEMEWSLSKVIRIESGDVSISVNDLRPLLTFLGVKDREVVAGLLADARLARVRQRKAWHQNTKYREYLPDGLRRLIEYESEAVTIRYYSIYFIHGPLQIPEYAKALMALFVGEVTPDRRDAALEIRRLRRESLLSRIGDLRLLVLLDESVLRRPIGGPAVFAAQLRELLRLTEKGLTMRMVPFTLEGAPVTNNGTFDLISIGKSDEQGMVLYRENGMTDELVEDQGTVLRHASRFDKVWEEAANEADTISFIRGRIEDLDAISAGGQEQS